MVYARTLGSQSYTFQVSGMLWRNSLIMRDRETGSLWSHVTGEGLSGPAKGKRLEKSASVQTTWKNWRAAHPDTRVLKKSEEVLSSHYQKYFDDPERNGLFRSQWLMEKMPGKTKVHGAVVGAHAVAITDGAFESDGLVFVDLGGTPVVMVRGGDGGVRAFEARGQCADTTLKFGRPVARAEISTIFETTVAWLRVDDQAVAVRLKPFENLTIRIRFSGSGSGGIE